MPRSVAVVLLALVAGPALAQKQFGFDNTKASGQPYLSPDETVKRMTVPPEFEVKLFAGEPLLANPIAFTIDERGRVWAIECFEYPSRTPKGKMPRDRIVILEDTDGDGKADKRTVFAEGKDFPMRFDLASGIEVGHGGVFVGAPPYLWFIENKDDKPGTFTTLLKGFGSEDTHETLNTFQWGPDGWLYGMHGVFTNSKVSPGQLDGPETRMNAAVWRYHPTTKKFEVFAEGTSNPWGLDWRNTDGQFILACCVIPHLFHIVPGAVYKRQAGASFNPHVYGYVNEICDHTFHKESGWAHAGLISLDVPHVPERFRNSVIFGSIHGCSVKQNVLKPNGSSFTASRGDDFLVSGDKNFRPINMKWGPNGDIYLIDWHDQNPCHQAKADAWDYERGRVYRIQLKGRERKKAEDLGAKGDLALIDVAGEADPYRYRTALRLLRERVPQDMVEHKPGQITPIRALWMGDAIRALGERNVRDFRTPARGYADDEAWVIRWLSDSGYADNMTVEKLVPIAESATGVSVRRELASAAIRLGDKHDVTPLLRALMSCKADATDPLIPHLTWLAYEKVIAKKDGASNATAEKEIDWLIANAPGNNFVNEQIAPKVMRRLVATGQPGDLALCVKYISDVKHAPSAKFALAGLMTALKDQTTNAPANWPRLQQLLLASKDAALIDYAGKLAVAFRDPNAAKRALAAIRNPGKRPDEERVEAVRQLALLKNPEAVSGLLGLVKDDKSEAVRVEAARALVSFPDRDIPQVLVLNWKAYTPAVRAEVVNVLGSRKEWAAALLSAMKEGVIDRAAVTDSTITRIQGFKDRGLNDLIEETWGRTRATPDQLQATIDKMRGELAAGPGSFARGKAVFTQHCGKCHKFDGTGAEVGPALDGAGRDIEYLLANVLDPNRVIGAPYFVRQATLQDGQLVQGVLAEEDERSLTLKVENGTLKKIQKADLDGPVKVLEKSMMPEGLGYSMTTQDFRDLVRYVMNHPFLTDVKVNGQPAKVGVSGRIALQQTGQPATVTATITATGDVRTQLLIGATGPFKVLLDGKPVGEGAGVKESAPDRESVPLTLPKGDHTLTITASGGAIYARLMDPDRKLRYPDAGEKK